MPSSTTAMPAGTRNSRMPRTHIGIAVQPPAAITDEPVIREMASAIPRTASTNRAGRRRILASANRRRRPEVLPDDLTIAGDPELVTIAGTSISTIVRPYYFGA